ncbi:MAG: hypothetical protein ACI31G_00200 [Bacilli bacterium]
MKSKFKGTVSILSVLFGVMLAGFIALFVVVGLQYPLGGGIVAELRIFLEAFLDSVTFQFGFTGALSIPTYVTYGHLLVALILIVVDIVVVAVKKKPIFLLFIVAILLGVVPSLQVGLDMSLIGVYLDGIKNTTDIATMIVCYATVITADLTLLLMIALFIVTACSYGEDEVEEDVLPTVVADEVKEEEATLEVEPEAESDDTLDSEVELMPVFETEPEPVEEVKDETPVEAPVVETTEEEVEVEPEPAPVVEEVKEPTLTKEDILSFLRDSVRDIVRDEIARNNLEHQEKCHKDDHEHHPTTDNHSITGATFGGPLIVQNFYGVNPTQNVQAPVEAKKEEPVEPKVVERIIEKHIPVEVVRVVKEEQPVVKEEVVKEEVKEPVKEVVTPAPVKEEVAPLPVVVEEVKPAPVVEEVKEAPATEEVAVEKKPIIRIPFETRMLGADQEMKDNYNTLKNEILSYGVKSRVSNSGDTFRLHRKTYVKITIAGKSLKCYFALDPEEYRESTVPVQDAGEKNVYADIPLVFKVKSALSVKRAKQLIQDVMEKNELEQGEVGNVDWVKELENSSSNSDNSED